MFSLPSSAFPFSMRASCLPPLPPSLRPTRQPNILVHAAEGKKGAGSVLETIIRRKKSALDAEIKSLGNEGLEARLKIAEGSPRRFLVASAIAKTVTVEARPAVFLECARLPTTRSPSDLAALAKLYSSFGVDGLVVNIDQEDSPTGLEDLAAVAKAVDVPVLARDWIIHPLQIAAARDAGAAGSLGVICQILNKGSVIVSSYGAAQGIDVPVEVVNQAELDLLSAGPAPVPFYALQCSIRITLSIPGFRKNMIRSLLASLPDGALSIVGVGSEGEAMEAFGAGATALFVRREFLDQEDGSEEKRGAVQRLLRALRAGPPPIEDEDDESFRM